MTGIDKMKRRRNYRTSTFKTARIKKISDERIENFSNFTDLVNEKMDSFLYKQAQKEARLTSLSKEKFLG